MTAHRVFLAVLASVVLSSNVGATTMESGDWDDCKNGSSRVAIDVCTRYIKNNQKMAEAYFYRARAWQLDNEYDRAMQDYNKAIQFDSNYASSYNNRGLIFKRNGVFDRALADFDKAIKLHPGFSIAYNNRGDLLDSVGDYDRAIADYTKAIEIDPRYARAYSNRGISLGKKGDHDRAIANFDMSIRFEPEYAPAYYNRALSFERNNDLQSALMGYKKFMVLSPDNTHVPKKIADIEKKINATTGGQSNPTAPAPAQTSAPVVQTPAAPAQASAPAAQTPAPAAQTSAPPVQPAAPSTTRVALLIGNGTYENATRLENPARDVDLLERTFRAAGFAEVVVRKNLDQASLMRELQAFRPIARKADVAIVYYAGHAIQMNGVNHLIPIDAKLKRDADVDLETVNASLILSAADGAGRLKIMILDACRDNPFANAMVRTAATRSIGRGLARVETSKGEYVAFSTREGSVAADGDGQNSPFAAALAKRIEQKPPLELRRLFDYVRDDVMSATGNNQQPFYYGSLPADLEFHFAR